jgi:hypothetical protein
MKRPNFNKTKDDDRRMTKLHQFNTRKPCYFCGAVPPSKAEHAPPRSLFRGADCDSITVPSCDEHNLDKSGVDQLFAVAHACGADEMVRMGFRAAYSGAPGVVIESAKSAYDRVKNRLSLVPLLADPPEGLDGLIPYTRGPEPYGDWTVKLTAALVWSVIGQYEASSDWAGAWYWSVQYMKTPRRLTTEEMVIRIREKRYIESLFFGGLRWMIGWSAQPRAYPNDIYRFDVATEEDQITRRRIVSFRHLFLDSHISYVRFACSDATAAAIIDRTTSSTAAGVFEAAHDPL